MTDLYQLQGKDDYNEANGSCVWLDYNLEQIDLGKLNIMQNIAYFVNYFNLFRSPLINAECFGCGITQH